MAGTGPAAAVSGSSSVAFMLRAFRYRNYRLFFGGQIVSLLGTWISTTAMSWLVYRLTGSALLLGVIGFSSQIPSFLLTPIAGIFVDRWNRHRLLVGTQAASMTLSFVLAALTLTHRISIPWLIVVSIVQGAVNAFDMPGRQTFVVSLIEDRNDLGNAIALNSSMFNAARLVGPSVAGTIIALSNEGWCFLIDGFSYLAVITALLAMRVPRRVGPALHHESPLAQFRDGWQYTAGSRPIRSVILLIALVCLAGAPYVTLMPIFAADVLHGGANMLGFLMTAAGGGALLGALWLASRTATSTTALSRNIVGAGTIFSCALAGFAFSTVVWLSIVLMVVVGFGMIVLIASSNTLVQTVVEDARRGRVMSFFLMAYFGTAPFGSLAAGAASARIGVSYTLAIGGAVCLAAVAWFALRLPLTPSPDADYVDRNQAIPATTAAIAATREAE